jgi:hypothetical protein
MIARGTVGSTPGAQEDKKTDGKILSYRENYFLWMYSWMTRSCGEGEVQSTAYPFYYLGT